MTLDPTPEDYRNEIKPIWCPGCGDYAVLKSFTRAFANLAIPKENIVMVSGIGCSSRLVGYSSTYTFNTVHGRAIPIATGIKAVRPELTVVVVAGDGDAFSIGGGHIPHAVRRGVDLTALVIDNRIYGLTKGQASPTTPKEFKLEKGLAGPDEDPLNPVLSVLSCGAPFVARVDATNMPLMTSVIQEAIQYPDFAFIHCLAACVTYQGREVQEEMKKKMHHLSEMGHDPSDYKAAFKIARDDSYALGIIYRR